MSNKLWWLKIYFTSLFLVIFCQISAQKQDLNALEENLKNSFGFEKVRALNALSQYYDEQNFRKSLRYARQAVNISEDIISNKSDNSRIDSILYLETLVQCAELLFKHENYFESRSNFETALIYSDNIKYDKHRNTIEFHLSEIQSLIDKGEIKDNFFNRTFNEVSITEVINEASRDFKINSEINLAKKSESEGDFRKAIDHYQTAINYLKNKGESQKISELKLRIAILLDSLEDFTQAGSVLDSAIVEAEKEPIRIIYQDSLKTNFIEKSDLENLKKERSNLKELSDRYAKEKDFDKSIAYYKRYLEYSQRIKEDSLRFEEVQKRKEAEITLLKQQKKIAELNNQANLEEKEKQVRLRNTSIFIAVIILISTLIALYFYLSKRKEHKKLSVAYIDLEKTKQDLEKAEQKITRLLKQQVSSDIAGELILNKEENIAKKHYVCVMFLDIRSFTPKAEKMSAEALIKFQNDIFSFMIDIIQANHGNINQLLGDGFMATFGAPVSHGNDCQNAFNASISILNKLEEFNSDPESEKINIGIGLHAGLVVTGNVGNETRKQYSVTGNPVILASRIEQLNKTYNSSLIISDEVFKKLDQESLNYQEKTSVKVKGRKQDLDIIIIQ